MDKRQQIIQSALELFTNNGFHATSTTSITKLAGVGTGTLFTYFKNKDELVNTIYREIKAEFAHFLKVNRSTDNTPYDQLKSIWNCAIEWSCNNLTAFLFLQQFSHSTYINSITKEEAIGGFSFMLDILDAAQEMQYIKPIPADLFFSLVHGNINSIVMYIKETGISPEAISAESFSYIWEGIRK